ncbi:hypothetical protein CCP2SC5_1220003 [Azospirillaceae bacterium]
MRKAYSEPLQENGVSFYPVGAIAEMCRAGHKEMARKLVTERGGIKVRVPKKENVNKSKLAKVIGVDAVNFLSNTHGGKTICIPLCSRRLGVKKIILESKTGASETARRAGCHVTYVFRLRAMEKKAIASQKDAI